MRLLVRAGILAPSLSIYAQITRDPYQQYAQPFLHAGLIPDGVNASVPGIDELFYSEQADTLKSNGIARPSVVASRTNNATLAGNETDRFSGAIAPLPPLYNIRFNISNTTFPDTKLQAAVSTGAQYLFNGVIEVILPESEVSRLARERKTLEFRLFNIGRHHSHLSQADDGSCNVAMNATCRDALITGILYNPHRDNTGVYPKAFQAQCGDVIESNYGPVVAVQGISGASAAPIFTSQNIPPSSGVSFGEYGYLGSGWNSTAETLPNDKVSIFDGTSQEFNSYVRFIDIYNGTASRSSLNSLNFGNSTQSYYDSLALVRAFVVLERYVDPWDALNGTEYASVSCIRPNVVQDDTLQVPELFWQSGFNATTGNVTDPGTSAAVSLEARFGIQLGFAATIVAVVLVL